ncbi:hypothetical protein CEXT_190361 [Caerostris extrusa]|uniref:Uncharacterized protein n=1 Tax=Caerostris extrusa TaxID=172846 RepID=A0AAV4XXR1_CAEEX|nr:hypothetical protein CEXT_190361 [Caerostris extrusa]
MDLSLAEAPVVTGLQGLEFCKEFSLKMAASSVCIRSAPSVSNQHIGIKGNFFNYHEYDESQNRQPAERAKTTLNNSKPRPFSNSTTIQNRIVLVSRHQQTHEDVTQNSKFNFPNMEEKKPGARKWAKSHTERVIYAVYRVGL